MCVCVGVAEGETYVSCCNCCCVYVVSLFSAVRFPDFKWFRCRSACSSWGTPILAISPDAWMSPCIVNAFRHLLSYLCVPFFSKKMCNVVSISSASVVTTIAVVRVWVVVATSPSLPAHRTFAFAAHCFCCPSKVVVVIHNCAHPCFMVERLVTFS